MPEFTIAAGEHTVWDHQADGVLCTEANLPTFTLTAQLRDGGQARRTGFRRGYEWRPGTFNRLEIENPHSVDLVVSLEAFTGDLIDRRLITAPNAIDPVRIDELRGKAYRLKMGRGATASEYSIVQGWNPAGSGKIAVVRGVWVSADSAGPVFCKTLSSNIGGNKDQDGAPLYAGDPAGATQAWSNANAALQLGNPALFALRVVANNTQLFEFDAPAFLPPGYGVALEFRAVNVGLNCSMETLEVDS